MEEKIRKVEEAARKTFEKERGSHDMSHTERVYNMCVHIGRKENADLNVLKVASLLHDIEKPREQKEKGAFCHAVEGAKKARKILEELDFDTAFVEKVYHCIACHRYRNNLKPESLEAKILFDADKLDSIGAIGIARDFFFAAETKAKIHNTKEEALNSKEYSEDDTAYREFLVKLIKVKDRMLTSEGKRIAEERHKFMEDFFERLNRETKGEL